MARTIGLDFRDGSIPLLDLRFADDILLFAERTSNYILLFAELSCQIFLLCGDFGGPFWRWSSQIVQI